MDRFEYKILNVSKSHLNKEQFQSELIETLNNLGYLGWEIISAEGINETSLFSRGSETTDLLLFFKRRIPQ